MSYINLHEYSEEIVEENVYGETGASNKISKPKENFGRNDSEQTEENLMKGAVELGLLHRVTEDPMNEILH